MDCEEGRGTGLRRGLGGNERVSWGLMKGGWSTACCCCIRQSFASGMSTRLTLIHASEFDSRENNARSSCVYRISGDQKRFFIALIFWKL